MLMSVHVWLMLLREDGLHFLWAAFMHCVYRLHHFSRLAASFGFSCTIRCCLQGCAQMFVLELPPLLVDASSVSSLYQLQVALPATIGVFAIDRLVLKGALFETVARFINPSYKNKIIRHEAGAAHDWLLV